MSVDIQQPSWAADLHPPRWYWLLPLTLPLLAVAFILYQSTQVLPRLALFPGYSLIDQNGKRLTSETMRGSLVLYAFPQADCATPCTDVSDTSDASVTLSRLHQALEEPAVEGIEGIPLAFVTISSANMPQPGDTGEQAQLASSENWHYVNADRGQFRPVFEAQSVSGDGVAGSTPLLALVDGLGIVRALYTQPDLAQIQTDLHSVAREARNSAGVNHYAYEAVHLFLCHNNISVP